MKIITLIMCLVSMTLTSFSQSIIFSYKLNELSARLNFAKDSVIVNEHSLKIRFDSSGIDKSTRFKVLSKQGIETIESPNDIMQKVFDFTKNPRLELMLEFWEDLEISDTISNEYVTITYGIDTTYKIGDRDTTYLKSVDTTTKLINQNNLTIALSEKRRKILQISSAFIKLDSTLRSVKVDQRTISITFIFISRRSPSLATIPENAIQRMAELAADKQTDSIGEFSTFKNEILVRSGLSSMKNSIAISKVKKIEITTAYGAIARRGLRVELQNGMVFINEYAPISLPRLRYRKGDKLVSNDSRNNNYLEVGDIIDYHSFGRFNYPEDQNYVLTYEVPTAKVRVSSSLNSLVDLSIYTDLLGLLGKKANGLIQSEISGNFISNSANLKNTDIVFHNFMRPYVRLSKFDSKFGELDSSNIKVGTFGRDTVSRTYLNQISYFQAGLLINLVRFGMGVNQYLYVNLGGDINLANADSLYKKDVLFFNFYPELTYSILRLNNFGLECSVRFMKQYLGSAPSFANHQSAWMFRPQASLFFYPTTDTGKKIYIRFNYFDNWENGQFNFAQFQFGYKTNLNFKK